jgi:hypothetical protein
MQHQHFATLLHKIYNKLKLEILSIIKVQNIFSSHFKAYIGLKNPIKINWLAFEGNQADGYYFDCRRPV